MISEVIDFITHTGEENLNPDSLLYICNLLHPCGYFNEFSAGGALFVDWLLSFGNDTTFKALTFALDNGVGLRLEFEIHLLRKHRNPFFLWFVQVSRNYQPRNKVLFNIACNFSFTLYKLGLSSNGIKLLKSFGITTSKSGFYKRRAINLTKIEEENHNMIQSHDFISVIWMDNFNRFYKVNFCIDV